MLLHLNHGFKKTKHHFDLFHIKHNVSARTLGLLIVLAVQVNLLSIYGMLPIQNEEYYNELSYAGSLLVDDRVEESFIATLLGSIGL